MADKHVSKPDRGDMIVFRIKALIKLELRFFSREPPCERVEWRIFGSGGWCDQMLRNGPACLEHAV